MAVDSKTIAFVVVFAALTVALNLSPIKIPAPYAPFLIYQIWEIPIVAAFLLYGPRVGIPISIINTGVLLAIFPGELPTGPFYNLAAVLSMLLGIYVVGRFSSMRLHSVEISGSIATIVTFLATYTAFQQRLFDLTIIMIFVGLISWIIFMVSLFSRFLKQRQGVILTISTTVGMVFRVGLMTAVNWLFLPFPPPLGFGLPTNVVVASLPLIGLFNATLALYTIPIGYLLARTINSSTKSARLK